MPERYKPVPVPVLLVDDRAENLTVLRHYLDDPDLELVSVQTGEQALRAVLKKEFALVLLDVQLPDLSGFEVANHLKALDRTRHLPIIFLTAFESDMAQLYEAYTVGAVDYLMKPVDRLVLKRKTEVFVDLYRQRRALLFHEATARQAERREHALQVAELRLASDQRYRTLVRGIENAIAWSIEPKTRRLVFLSEQTQRVLHFSPLELAEPGQWIQRIPDGDREAFVSALEKAVQERTDVGLSHRLIDADGRVVWFRTVMSGQVPGDEQVHGISLDVTDLKRAELNQRFLAEAAAALAEPLDFHAALERLAQLLVPSLADACVVDGATEEGLGDRLVVVHPDAQAVERARAVSGEDESLAEIGPVQVLRSGSAVLMQGAPGRLLADDHPGVSPVLTALQAEAFISIPLRPRGELRAVVTLVSRSPERRFGEGELALAEELVTKSALTIDNARLYEEARQATEARDGMLAVVSHDLRNPLSAIALGARRIERLEERRESGAGGAEAAAPGQLQAVARRIHRAATRMERLLNDLMDLERIKSDRLHLEPSLHDASEIMSEAAELLQPVAAEHHLTLELAGSLTQTLRISADAERLQQVFWNLIGNAIKFTPEGGRIVLALEEAGECVRFSVTDTGPGLPEGSLVRVFEPRWQVDGRSARKGLGLGLAISRGIVEAHGGRIWAERPDAGGGRICFELPVVRSEEALHEAPAAH